MRLPSRTCRTAASLAASTIGLSTLLLTIPGIASASVPAPITSANDYSVSYTNSPGNPTSVTVNDGFCTAHVQVDGGQGGDNTTSSPAPGLPADEVSANIPVQAGQVYSFQIGGAASGDTAGTNPADATLNGHPAGTTGDGAGGAGTSLILNGGGVVASAKGGNGAGGASGGGATSFDSTHYTLDNGATNAFVGSTTDGSGWTAGGEVYVNVMACDAPYDPSIRDVVAQDTSAAVNFYPQAGDQTTAAPSGYQYSLDSGSTWTTVTTTQVDPSDTSPTAVRTFSLTGLTTGHAYSVELRATSAYNGMSAASAASSFTPLHTAAAPANVKATVGASSIHITWDAPAGETGITGYEAGALPGANPQSSNGLVLCPTLDASARECTVTVPAGTVYSVSVHALNPAPGYSGFVVSDVVPAPTAPATVPTASGSLSSGTGAVAASLTTGQKLVLNGSGYAPNSTVSLYVYSTPTLLATVPTDSAGSFSTSVTIPADLAPGAHHLVAAGLDTSGNVRYLRTDVTVATASNQLAWTGFETLPFVGVALLVLLAGIGLVVVGRRRRTA